MGWFSRSWRRAGRRHPSPLKPDRTYRRAFHSALSNPRYRANQTHTATYQPIGTPASGRHCPPQAGDRCPPDSDAPLSSLTVSDSGSAHSQPPSPRRAGHRHPSPLELPPAARSARQRTAVPPAFGGLCRPEAGVPIGFSSPVWAITTASQWPIRREHLGVPRAVEHLAWTCAPTDGRDGSPVRESAPPSAQYRRRQRRGRPAKPQQSTTLEGTRR